MFVSRNTGLVTVFFPLLSLMLMVAGCQPEAAPSSEEPEQVEGPHVVADDPVAAGRYIVAIAGCNDCHTDRYMEIGDQIPESERLTGSSIGWRGPWGTTYPRNLRLSVQRMTEDEWVNVLHTRTALPPMPWPSVNNMSEQDARAIHRYLQFLGPAGEERPAALPPEEEPATPYLNMVPMNLPE